MNPGGLELESFPLERRAATLDLVLLIIETAHSLSVSIRYNSDLFDAATIARIVRTLRNAIAPCHYSTQCQVGRTKGHTYRNGQATTGGNPTTVQGG